MWPSVEYGGIGGGRGIHGYRAKEDFKACELPIRQVTGLMESFSASQEVAARLREKSDDILANYIKRSPTMLMDSREEHALRAVMMVMKAA